MLDLTNISLVAIASNKIEETKKAIDICLSKCKFHDVLFFTHDNTVKNSIIIDELKSIKDYDKFVIRELPEYLREYSSDFFLTIHWDGFIVNENAWTPAFLDYDYIGAPWPHVKYMCGNGGFCLKSKKFINTQYDLRSNLDISLPDDVSLCIKHRSDFINAGCKFSDTKIGFKFSTECCDYWKFNSFGFHDFKYNEQFRKLIT